MDKKALMQLRNATVEDVPEIAELLGICRLGVDSYYQEDTLRAPMENYPQGQFVVEYEGKLLAYASSFRIGKDIVLKPHTWEEITGHGFAALHDPLGEYLYSMDLCIHPDYGDFKIMKRIMHARKRLCEIENLTGIVLCAPIPNYHRHKRRYPKLWDYLEAIVNKEVLEQEVSYKLSHFFEITDVLKDYMPSDKNSCGHAVLMVWHNPVVSADRSRRVSLISAVTQKDRLRVAILQYLQRPVKSFDAFAHNVEQYVRAVSEEGADFVLFPDLFMLQLLSMDTAVESSENTVLSVSGFTKPFLILMRKLAVKYDINIIAGSQPKRVDNKLYIVSSICLRDGEVHEQYKLHPTTNERFSWGVTGGDTLSVIDTDCGPIAVLINYDCEFPELARLAVEEGARMLFVPFSLGRQHDYMCLRYCAQARAVENHCFVIMAGNVGMMQGIPWMDVQYGQSSVFTPSGYAFARDAIAVDTPLNVEMIAYADLNLKVLETSRAQGSVVHMKERRQDLYTLEWRDKDE